MYERGLKGSTVINYHANIRTALKYACKMGYIQNNSADRADRPKKELFISSLYHEDEINVLFEKTKGDVLEIPIMLSAFYGLRRSEVLGIKWSVLDLINNTITIKHTVHEIYENGKSVLIMRDRTKNKPSYRTLPLVEEVAFALKKWKIQQDNKKMSGRSYSTEYEDYVCVDKMGSIIKPGYVTQHFNYLLRKKELRPIRFHDLRHSCATLLQAKGIPLREIQAWLGHSTIQTTEMYAHRESISKQNSANVLSGTLKIG